MGARRQKIRQLELAFREAPRGEAPRPSAEGSEAPRAGRAPESPAFDGPTMEDVCQSANLRKAYAQVKRNKGGPGSDGMTVEDLLAYLQQHWATIGPALLDGTYPPQPVKRVEIPKPGGGVRLLGVPTVLDRFVQQAVLQVLQRHWDRTFSEHSYGFRPGRSAQQAVAQAQQYVREGFRWVVDIDLEKFLETASYCTPVHERFSKRVGW